MYENYYGLRCKPFENTPDPDFFYESKEAQEALIRLEYGIENRKGGLLLVGDYGCGKTMLIRRLLAERLAANQQEIAFIANPALTVLQLLREIYYQFTGKMVAGDKLEIVRAIEDFLFTTSQNNRPAILVIDEVQSMSYSSLLEEVRLLLNFQTDKEFLFTLLLSGQPGVLRLLESVPQLLQRLAVRFRLKPLEEEEVGSYVRWRFQVAGADTTIPLDDAAIQVVARYSGGVPRLINSLCDFALFAGMRLEKKTVDAELMEDLCQDFQNAAKP